MSFILDALKKSEAERQRQTGPTLLELRVTRPRRRYPAWAAVIGGLLALNVIVLLLVALHRPSGPNATASAAASASTRPAAAPNIAAVPATASVASAAPGPAIGRAAVPPLDATAGTAASATTPTTVRNPADDEPAVSAQAAGANSQLPAAGAPAQPTTPNYAALPSAASLGDQVPALQLNMLVSSREAADRYALINMHRVREGDVLPEGARVLAITPDGVAMEYQGQDFLLPRASTSAAQ